MPFNHCMILMKNGYFILIFLVVFNALISCDKNDTLRVDIDSEILLGAEQKENFDFRFGLMRAVLDRIARNFLKRKSLTVLMKIVSRKFPIVIERRFRILIPEAWKLSAGFFWILTANI